MTDDMRQRYSSGMPWGLSGRVGGLPEAACAFMGLGTAGNWRRVVRMALFWRFRRPEPRGAVQGGAMSRLATSRGRGEGPRRREDGFRDAPRGRKK